MLIALDVAILPPQAISQRAIELSAALPEKESKGLRLGGDVLPHITLTQQFIQASDLDAALDCAGAAIAGFGPLPLSVPGPARGGSSGWMAIELTPSLIELHRRLMDELRPFERPAGTATAFVDEDARPDDVAWVAGFRRTSSYGAFTPHITLGHAADLPAVESRAFDATTVAACHLGKFCACRRIFRTWAL
jgi:2'-5' RNA ligase